MRFEAAPFKLTMVSWHVNFNTHLHSLMSIDLVLRLRRTTSRLWEDWTHLDLLISRSSSKKASKLLVNTPTVSSVSLLFTGLAQTRDRRLISRVTASSYGRTNAEE